MNIFVLQEQHHNGGNHIVFASESLDKVKEAVRTHYKLSNDLISYLDEWKELYLVMDDIKLRIEEITLDAFPTFV